MTASLRRRCWVLLRTITFLACGVLRLAAHPELDQALERINERLLASPENAELYLGRGELYARHEDWVMAEANFLRAAELAPTLPRLDCARGALALANARWAEARTHLDRALQIDPRSAEALIHRSRARRALADRDGARIDLAAALALLANPRPELFLEYADLHARPEEALQALDSGIARIGPAITLHSRALALEESLLRFDDAVARIDRLAAVSERPEFWLKRRGDLLERAGRKEAARTSYAAALARIAALPEWLRDSPDAVRLVAELKSHTHSTAQFP